MYTTNPGEWIRGRVVVPHLAFRRLFISDNHAAMHLFSRGRFASNWRGPLRLTLSIVSTWNNPVISYIRSGDNPADMLSRLGFTNMYNYKEHVNKVHWDLRCTHSNCWTRVSRPASPLPGGSYLLAPTGNYPPPDHLYIGEPGRGSSLRVQQPLEWESPQDAVNSTLTF